MFVCYIYFVNDNNLQTESNNKFQQQNLPYLFIDKFNIWVTVWDMFHF